MVAILRLSQLPERIRRIAHLWREILTLLLCVAVAAAIVSSFLGASPGPYGNCFGSKGRPVPCELTKRGR